MVNISCYEIKFLFSLVKRVLPVLWVKNPQRIVVSVFHEFLPPFFKTKASLVFRLGILLKALHHMNGISPTIGPIFSCSTQLSHLLSLQIVQRASWCMAMAGMVTFGGRPATSMVSIWMAFMPRSASMPVKFTKAVLIFLAEIFFFSNWLVHLQDDVLDLWDTLVLGLLTNPTGEFVLETWRKSAKAGLVSTSSFLTWRAMITLLSPQCGQVTTSCRGSPISSKVFFNVSSAVLVHFFKNSN